MSTILMRYLLAFLFMFGCGEVTAGESGAVIADNQNAEGTEMSDKNYDWPQTSPIDKSDPYWEINNNLNVNGTPYKKEEVSPGRWEWVVDREQQALIDSIYDRADFLYTALRTRILTDEEYWEAVNLGRTLIVRPMAPYNQNEVQSMVDTAFLQQARLRAAYGMPLPKPKTLEITGNVRHDMETAAPPPASNEERE